MTSLRVIDLAPMMRAAVLDKSYRQHPMGQEWGRYLRALRWSGASENTLSSYETVADKFGRWFADFPDLERFCQPDGTELLYAFLEAHWGDASQATKAQRTAVVRSFFAWQTAERRIGYDPARSLKAPRSRGGAGRHAYPRDVLDRLVRAQPTLRDQVALGLLCRLGLRKNELRLMRVRDVDLTRNLVSVLHAKGGKTRVLPLEFADLREDCYLHIVGEGRHPDEYLIYPRADPTRPMDPASLHRWFKRALRRAGLPETVKLHEMRHSAADDFHRRSGNLMLTSRLLGHASVATTEIYLHPSEDDLRVAMRHIDDPKSSPHGK